MWCMPLCVLVWVCLPPHMCVITFYSHILFCRSIEGPLVTPCHKTGLLSNVKDFCEDVFGVFFHDS